MAAAVIPISTAPINEETYLFAGRDRDDQVPDLVALVNVLGTEHLEMNPGEELRLLCQISIHVPEDRSLVWQLTGARLEPVAYRFFQEKIKNISQEAVKELFVALELPQQQFSERPLDFNEVQYLLRSAIANNATDFALVKRALPYLDRVALKDVFRFLPLAYILENSPEGIEFFFGEFQRLAIEHPAFSKEQFTLESVSWRRLFYGSVNEWLEEKYLKPECEEAIIALTPHIFNAEDRAVRQFLGPRPRVVWHSVEREPIFIRFARLLSNRAIGALYDACPVSYRPHLLIQYSTREFLTDFPSSPLLAAIKAGNVSAIEALFLKCPDETAGTIKRSSDHLIMWALMKKKAIVVTTLIRCCPENLRMRLYEDSRNAEHRYSISDTDFASVVAYLDEYPGNSDDLFSRVDFVDERNPAKLRELILGCPKHRLKHIVSTPNLERTKYYPAYSHPFNLVKVYFECTPKDCSDLLIQPNEEGKRVMRVLISVFGSQQMARLLLDTYPEWVEREQNPFDLSNDFLVAVESIKSN